MGFCLTILQQQNTMVSQTSKPNSVLLIDTGTVDEGVFVVTDKTNLHGYVTSFRLNESITSGERCKCL